MQVIDLIKELTHAERRPDPAAFDVVTRTIGGVTRPAVAIPVPSRIVWTLRFPERATFRALVAVEDAASLPHDPIAFRAGVSDERRYDPLAHVEVASVPSEWIPLTADLSLYAGRKWSLFYRPDAHPWRLILSIDGAGDRLRALCADPGVYSDRDAARKYVRAK